MNAVNEIKNLIKQVEILTKEEEYNLRMISGGIRANNTNKILDELNLLSYEKNFINSELAVLNKELEVVNKKRVELQNKKAQLFERLNVIQNDLSKIVQMHDLLNSKSCKI